MVEAVQGSIGRCGVAVVAAGVAFVVASGVESRWQPPCLLISGSDEISRVTNPSSRPDPRMVPQTSCILT